MLLLVNEAEAKDLMSLAVMEWWANANKDETEAGTESEARCNVNSMS